MWTTRSEVDDSSRPPPVPLCTNGTFGKTYFPNVPFVHKGAAGRAGRTRRAAGRAGRAGRARWHGQKDASGSSIRALSAFSTITRCAPSSGSTVAVKNRAAPIFPV